MLFCRNFILIGNNLKLLIMKTRILVLLSALFCLTIIIPAQSPQKLNYQAVVRDASGNPVSNTTVGVRLSILQGSSSGTAVCVEEFSPLTNDFGLIVLEPGSVNTVEFHAIDWSAGPYFLKVEIDQTGGTSYTEMGTTQLLSVPYALHSESAGSLSGDYIWKNVGDNIYYDSGNVGIGITSPLQPLHIKAPVFSGREDILRFSVEDDFNSYFDIRNATSIDNQFIPIIVGSNQVDNRYSLIITGNTVPDYDIASEEALVLFDARREDSNPILNRPLFHWRNYNSIKMTMTAEGNLGLGTTEPVGDIHISDTLSPDAHSRIYLETKNAKFRTMAYEHSPSVWFQGGSDWTQGSTIDMNFSGMKGIPNHMTIKADGKIGIGTTTPSGQLEVKGKTDWPDEEPLFEVKNRWGNPVFSIYNNGVRVLIEDDPAKKGPKGGFAIGGFDPTKAGGTYDFMRITPDSIRFNINNEPSKGPKGGFAIGGFDRTKGDLNEDFMYVTPQNSNAGKYNTFLGYLSGENNSGEHNTFLGSYTGNSNENGSYNNFIGLNAGFNNTSGSSNCFIGNGAGMENTQGYGNVFVGNGAGVNNTEGFNNVYIGTNAGFWQTEGDYNIIIGPQWSGSVKPIRHRTIKIGAKAGFDDTGSDRLFIDGSTGGTTYTSSLIYGYYGAGTKKVRINGNLEYTGTSGQVSDKRLKTNIVCISDVLDKLSSVSGYYFDWNEMARENLVISDGKQIGMIAQELETVFPELVFENDEGYKNISYTQLTPVLLQAVKEQQSQIANQQKDIADLKTQITLLQQMVMEMAGKE